VRDYLVSDRAALGAVSEARASDEQLIVAEEGDTLSMALYIDSAVLERLKRHDPFAGSRRTNLADYLTVAEGVSHFVYVAWNTAYDKPVTLLELELQAEVDKYVLCAWLLREQGAGRFPRELHRALFERAHVDPVAAAGRVGLYHTASNYCRALLPACGRAAGTQAKMESRPTSCRVAAVLSLRESPQDAAHRTLRPEVACTAVATWQSPAHREPYSNVVVVLRLFLVQLALELDPLAELAQITLDGRLLGLGSMRQRRTRA